jgi:hypothetical protein
MVSPLQGAGPLTIVTHCRYNGRTLRVENASTMTDFGEPQQYQSSDGWHSLQMTRCLRAFGTTRPDWPNR